MTHTELAELATTPDGLRQIDAMAAERVMGWVVHHRNTALYYPADYNISTKPASAISEWRPTTSIADAWQLVEKMRADDYDVQVTARRWTTTCYIERYESIAAVITNESAPLAITIAALLAVEKKEKA